MTIFCPLCNRSSDTTRFMGEFCEFCVIEKLEKNMADKAEVTICAGCGKVKTGQGYVKLDRANLAVAIKTAMHLPDYVLHVEDINDNPANVVFSTEVDGRPVSFTRKIKLKVNKQRCLECVRKSAGYYEAIFKVHGDEQRVDKMSHRFTRFIENNGAFVSKVDRTGNGFDIYASDKKVANQFFVSNQLKVTRSYNLYGTKRGKKLYRNIYSMHLE